MDAMDLPPLANPDRVAALAVAEVIEPPPPIDLNAWARDNIEVHEGPFRGAYDPERFPWRKAVLRACQPDDPCQEVSWMKAVQIGGTLTAQIFIGGLAALDPAPAMFVHPVDVLARRFVRTKWRPFLRASKVLKRLFPEKTRDAGASLDFQERIDGRGFVQHAAAASPSQLSQVTIQRQVQDDIDKWVEDGETGDPEKAADGRSEAYRRAGQAKIFKIGNPVNRHNSRIYRAFLRGSQEHWHVPCPHCLTEQPLEWANMQAAIEFDRERYRAEGLGEDEAKERAAREAHFTCVNADCGRPIGETDTRRILPLGTWVAHNPRAIRRARSFYEWAAFVKALPEIARAWFDAKGNPGAEQTFLNELAGLPFETEGEAPPWEGLRDRAAKLGHDLCTIPEGGLILVATADCQGGPAAKNSRVEVHVQAFGAGLRRWTVDYIVVPGYIGDEKTRAELDQLLERTWTNAFGHKRRIERFGIDAGTFAADVQEWVKRHSPHRVWMVRGHKDQHAPDLVIQESRRQRRQARVLTGAGGHVPHWVGSAVVKGQIYTCLTKDDPLGPGWWGFPKGLDDEFFRQLCGEERRKKKGTNDWIWVQVYDNNEVLDTAVYGQALAVSLGWKTNSPARWEELRQRWETPAPQGPQGDLFAAAAAPDGRVPAVPAPVPPPPVPVAQAETASANAVRPSPAPSAGNGENWLT